MNFLFGDSIRLEQSFSSRVRTPNSKKGLKVTLSKQKSANSKHGNSTENEKQNFHGLSVHSFKSGTESEYNQSNNDNRLHLRSNQTEMMGFSENRSVQSDLISNYFEKSHQKQCVRKESAVLDEQIRKLQLQIYNTRTKITEAKYLANKQSETKFFQTIKNSRKSKQSAKAEQLHIKSNKSLKNHNNQPSTVKASRRRVQEKVYSAIESQQLNSRSPITVIHNKSPTKLMYQDQSRSPSPPHPSILRQMLSSKKKPVTGSEIFQNQQNQIYRKEISMTEQPKYELSYHLGSVSGNKMQQIDVGKYAAGSVQISSSLPKNQSIFEQKKEKKLKKSKKDTSKKRSMSAYSSHHASMNRVNSKNNQQKVFLRSSEEFIKRKSQISDFDIDLQKHLSRPKNTSKVYFLSNFQNNKQTTTKMSKKGMFGNDLLTKAYQQEQKSTSNKVFHVQKDNKSNDNRKKSSKKHQTNTQKALSNFMRQSSKIHSMLNNSSNHSTIKSKYIKQKIPFH